MTVFRSKNVYNRKIRESRTSAAGPASYDSGTRPTMTFTNLRCINAVDDVLIAAEGYEVEIVSVSGNVVTYKVLSNATHTHGFTGNALATHQHNIVTVGAAGGGNLLTQPAGATRIESAGAGQTNTNAIAGKTGGTPSGTNAAQTKAAKVEVANGTVLNGITFYGKANGW